MYRTTSVMALGLFLGLAPIGALAQTQTEEPETQQLTQPETEQSTETETLQTDDQQATDTETLQTDDQQATETEMMPTEEQATETEVLETEEQTTETETLETEEQTTETDTLETDEEADVATEEVIPEQDESELLASTLMGAPVNLADEEIGSVSDLIIAEDNKTIRGVVVGVGGFLGIGEKRVALPMERITVQAGEPGEVELATDMTREELEQQEAFKTAAQVKSEQEAEQAQQQMGTQPAAPAVPAQ